MDIDVCTKPEELPPALQNDQFLTQKFVEIAETMGREDTLLKVTGPELHEQWGRGLSCLAVSDGEIVGHVTARLLHESQEFGIWFEYGSVFVSPQARGHDLYKRMYSRMRTEFLDDVNQIGKSKNAKARRAGKKSGFVFPVLRKNFPEPVRTTVCGKCPVKLMRAEHWGACKLAWGEKQYEGGFGPEAKGCVFRPLLTTIKRHDMTIVSTPEDFQADLPRKTYLKLIQDW